jgi:4'-phosphopantetheinyl transferase
VWWAHVGAARDGLADLLDEAERARWQTLRHGRSRALYLVAHALTRVVLGAHLRTEPAALRLAARCRHCGGPHGKPYLPSGTPRLSLSHSGEFAVVALADEVEVGVDVEHISLAGARIPVNALAEPEAAVLEAVPEAERVRAFIRYWTRKEALLKATGDGLVVSTASVALSGPADPPAVLSWSAWRGPPIHLHDLADRPGHLAGLAMLGRRLRVAEYDGNRLLRDPGHRRRAGRTVAGRHTRREEYL